MDTNYRIHLIKEPPRGGGFRGWDWKAYAPDGTLIDSGYAPFMALTRFTSYRLARKAIKHHKRKNKPKVYLVR